MSTPYYVTTAIAYPNGAPHVGHAYEYIATDAIARFKRLDGFDVRFLTGTDVHGLKMAQTADRRGHARPPSSPAETPMCSRPLQERLGISFDRFIRTTDADHIDASNAIWQRMNEAGDIYLDSYAGWYSVRDERFYAEDETRTARRRIPLLDRNRYPRDVDRGADLLLPAVGVHGPAARALRADTRSSSAPTCGATRWSASSPAACATCPSRAPPSTGACPCPITPTMSCTCGWTR